jgi:hypothetical protein
MGFQYDDSNLQRLFAEMEPKQRLQALKGGFRREANQVRKTAVNNLRSTGIRTDRDLESGVRAVVFKKQAGFRVTIGTKKAGKSGGKSYGFHKNRQGLEKPILIWAEGGTEERRTKSNAGKHTRRFTYRLRKGHYTGRMRRYGFMKQTSDQVAGTVTENLHNEVIRSVEKVAKKYGCI